MSDQNWQYWNLEGRDMSVALLGFLSRAANVLILQARDLANRQGERRKADRRLYVQSS